MSVIIVGLIVFSFIVLPTPLKFSEDPMSITIYNYSKATTGITTTKSNSYKETYEELLEEFTNCSNLSVFSRAFSGANIYDKPSQDIAQERPTWSTANKNATTIELLFENKQSIIVTIDRNTKKIDFYGIAMVVSDSVLVHEVALYYKTNRNTSYTSSPILMSVKTNKLYNLINLSIDKYTNN